MDLMSKRQDILEGDQGKKIYFSRYFKAHYKSEEIKTVSNL